MSKLHEQIRFIKNQHALAKAREATKTQPQQEASSQPSSPNVSLNASPRPSSTSYSLSTSPVGIREHPKPQINIEDNPEIIVAKRKLTLEQERINAEKEALRISKERMEQEKKIQDEQLRAHKALLEERINAEKEAVRISNEILEQEKRVQQENLEVQAQMDQLKRDYEKLVIEQATVFKEKLAQEKEVFYIEQKQLTDMRAMLQEEKALVQQEKEKMQKEFDEFHRYRDMANQAKERMKLEYEQSTLELKQLETVEETKIEDRTSEQGAADSTDSTLSGSTITDFELI